MPQNNKFRLRLRFINDASAEIALFNGTNLVGLERFSFNHDLDQVLLLTLDKLLLKHTMSLISFKTYQIMGRVSRCGLSYQIAKAVLSGVE